MTDEHTPTQQEQDLYDALNNGDHETIEDMRVDAYEADQTPPQSRDTEGEAPEDWLPPAEQYDVDYANAHAHYQADHEMPEQEREEATRERAQAENEYAERAMMEAEASGD